MTVKTTCTHGIKQLGTSNFSLWKLVTIQCEVFIDCYDGAIEVFDLIFIYLALQAQSKYVAVL